MICTQSNNSLQWQPAIFECIYLASQFLYYANCNKIIPHNQIIYTQTNYLHSIKYFAHNQIIYTQQFNSLDCVYVASPFVSWCVTKSIMLWNYNVVSSLMTMLSTVNATQAGPLLHTRTLGCSLVVTLTRQVWYGRQCAKNEMFSLQNKCWVLHSLRTHPTTNWLKGRKWVKQTTISSNSSNGQDTRNSFEIVKQKSGQKGNRWKTLSHLTPALAKISPEGYWAKGT